MTASLLAILPLAGLLLGAFVGIVGARGGMVPLIATAFSLGTFCVHLALFAPSPSFTLPYVEPLGFSLSFTLSPWRSLFALLISGIGVLIFAYSHAYFKNDPRRTRVFGWLLVFQAAMLGVVTADDLLLLFMFWELTSISSFFLIGLDHGEYKARRAALQALLVTGLGGVALLVGALVLREASGTFLISSMLVARDSLTSHPLIPFTAAMVLIAALSKSAQFPFHFWLPGAMAAPSPISAYLHSATMVKAGIFLLALLQPLFTRLSWWSDTIIISALATLFIGATQMLRERDMKLMLAHSTVAALGSLVLLIGIGTPLALLALFVALLAHALYKGALFLAVGSIDHETGTRDIDALRGLLRTLPFTGSGALIALLSMMGIPPLLGFLGKELLLEATLNESITIGALLALALTLVAGGALLIARTLVTGSPSHPDSHEGLPLLWLPSLLLGGFSLALFLILPALSFLGSNLVWDLQLATTSLPPLKMWHGVTPALIASVCILIGALAIVMREKRVVALLICLPRFAERVFDWFYTALLSHAAKMTALFQTGSLRRYLHYAIGTTLVASTGVILVLGLPALPAMITPPRLHELLLGIAVIGGTLSACSARTIMSALAALGVVGTGIALFFATLGAPDLAITQFVAETLSIIMLVLLVRSFPDFSERSSILAEARDRTIGVVAGALVFVLTLFALAPNTTNSLAEYFLKTSVPGGHGQNVVNVILVDFRALDTLGEITVLGIAGIGVFALLKLRTRRESQ